MNLKPLKKVKLYTIKDLIEYWEKLLELEFLFDLYLNLTCNIIMQLNF